MDTLVKYHAALAEAGLCVQLSVDQLEMTDDGAAVAWNNTGPRPCSCDECMHKYNRALRMVGAITRCPDHVLAGWLVMEDCPECQPYVHWRKNNRKYSNLRRYRV